MPPHVSATPPDPVAVVRRVSPRRALVVLLAIDVAFVAVYAASLIAQGAGRLTGEIGIQVARLLDLNAESSIPTWWETILLAAAAALLVGISVLVRPRGGREWWAWRGLAGVFIVLSIDEAVSIHEITVAPLQRLLDVSSGPWAATWVYPVGILLVLGIVLYLRFFVRLPSSTRLLFAVSLAVFVIGAAGLEVVEWGITDPWIAGRPPLSYLVLVGIEELLETVGVTLFIVALLRHLRDHVPALHEPASAVEGGSPTDSA